MNRTDTLVGIQIKSKKQVLSCRFFIAHTKPLHISNIYRLALLSLCMLSICGVILSEVCFSILQYSGQLGSTLDFHDLKPPSISQITRAPLLSNPLSRSLRVMTCESFPKRQMIYIGASAGNDSGSHDGRLFSVVLKA